MTLQRMLLGAANISTTPASGTWIQDDFSGTAGANIEGTTPGIYGPGTGVWVNRNPGNANRPLFSTFSSQNVGAFRSDGSFTNNLTINLGTLPSGNFTISARLAFSNNLFCVNGTQGFLLALTDSSTSFPSSNTFGIRFGVDTAGSNAGRMQVFNISEVQLGSNIFGITSGPFYDVGYNVDGSSVTGIFVKNSSGTTLYSYITSIAYTPRSRIGLQHNASTSSGTGYVYVDYIRVTY